MKQDSTMCLLMLSIDSVIHSSFIPFILSFLVFLPFILSFIGRLTHRCSLLESGLRMSYTAASYASDHLRAPILWTPRWFPNIRISSRPSKWFTIHDNQTVLRKIENHTHDDESRNANSLSSRVRLFEKMISFLTPECCTGVRTKSAAQLLPLTTLLAASNDASIHCCPRKGSNWIHNNARLNVEVLSYTNHEQQQPRFLQARWSHQGSWELASHNGMMLCWTLRYLLKSIQWYTVNKRQSPLNLEGKSNWIKTHGSDSFAAEFLASKNSLT